MGPPHYPHAQVARAETPGAARDTGGADAPRARARSRRPPTGDALPSAGPRPPGAAAAAAPADRAGRLPRLADRPDPGLHPGSGPPGRRDRRSSGAARRCPVCGPGGGRGALAGVRPNTQCRPAPGGVSLNDGMATRATTVQITMPQMGESVTEGTILEWLKQVGDRVEADEPLVEVSTDKVDAEVPAPAAGTLTKILAEADSTVAVGAVLGEIEADGDGAAPLASEPDAPHAEAAAPASEPDAPHAEAAAPASEPSAPPTEAAAPAASASAGETAPASASAPPEPASAEADLVDVAIPEMGDSVAEGTVLEWLGKVGDTRAR